MNQSSEILISIVSPVYRAEGMISELVERIQNAVKTITDDYEIILIEDGSPDKSWDEIVLESAKNQKIKGIKLSRNFGQHFAITAGLDYAKGNWVVVMDCDLQDRPEEIPNLYQKAMEGYEIVLAKRKNRTDGFWKKMSSKIFYKTLSYLTGAEQDASIANFGIYHSKIVDSLKLLREPIRYFPTMVKWVGFKKTTLTVKHGDRYLGQTSYDWKKLIRLSIDIVLANSDKPIRVVAKLGLTISFISFLIGIAVLYRYFMNEITVQGYTSILVSLWFIGGMILFVLGLIGLYIGKIFAAVKNRPIYIVNEIVNII